MHAQLCKRYLGALESGNLEEVLALFTADATVDSPLYGVVPATQFYAGLFSDTRSSETRLINTFTAAGERSVALHFVYTWTLGNGKRVEFECVDVFDIAPHDERFARLKIIYDTAAIRPEFEQSRKSG